MGLNGVALFFCVRLAKRTHYTRPKSRLIRAVHCGSSCFGKLSRNPWCTANRVVKALPNWTRIRSDKRGHVHKNTWSCKAIAICQPPSILRPSNTEPARPWGNFLKWSRPSISALVLHVSDLARRTTHVSISLKKVARGTGGSRACTCVHTHLGADREI